jgi:hypothetical protein
MSDNSNSDTEADEQTVAELKERIGELEERVEQQESQGPSRRQFLGSLTGIASAGAAGYYLGTQRAQAAPSWGSASGQMGTQSTPLQQVIAQTGTFQSVDTGIQDIGQLIGRAALDSTFTLTDNTIESPIPLETTVKEDSDIVTVDLANDKITIDTAGSYRIEVLVSLNSPGTSTAAYTVPIVGGNTPFSRWEHGAFQGRNLSMFYPWGPEAVSAGTDVQMEAFQQSGSDVDLNPGKNATELRIYKLG